MTPGRRTRILYLIGSLDPGGAERVLVDLATGLSRERYDVTVGHLGNQWLATALGARELETEILTFSRFYSSHWTEWRFVLELASFIRKRGFDLIHAHLFGMTAYGSLAAKLAGRPVIGTIHDKYHFSTRWHRQWMYKVVQLAGCRLVAVSEDIRSSLVERAGLRQEGIRVLHNGTDIDLLGGDKGRVAKRSEFGFRDSDIVVTAVGRLTPIKGQESVLRVAKELVREDERLRFLIVGDGPDKPRLQDMIADSGLTAEVVLAGHREDVGELLSVSDIFVQASSSEGLSCTIIEALASGLPVVLTDVGGNSEIVADGNEGFLVQHGDVSGLCRKILLLARDPQLRSTIGRRARGRARSSFSLAAMLQAHDTLYSETLQ